MNAIAPQIGQLLLAGSKNYAASTARLLLDQNPDIARRGGPDALVLWRLYLADRLEELGTSLILETPELFAADASWSGLAVQARDASPQSFITATETLRSFLEERLPPASTPLLSACFDAATESLSQSVQVNVASLHPSALQFLQFALEGMHYEAEEHLLEEYRSGKSLVEIFEDVVVPAQREVGDLWHRNEINIAEEHLATLTTQRAIAVLSHHVKRAQSNGLTTVIASVTGDSHDLGLRLLSELFTEAGWRSIGLGADLPRLDLMQALEAFEADLLVLSATLAPQLLSVKKTIDAVRTKSRTPKIKILVGGRAFMLHDQLWQRVGGDAWSRNLRHAVTSAEDIVSTA